MERNGNSATIIRAVRLALSQRTGATTRWDGLSIASSVNDRDLHGAIVREMGLNGGVKLACGTVVHFRGMPEPELLVGDNPATPAAVLRGACLLEAVREAFALGVPQG